MDLIHPYYYDLKDVLFIQQRWSYTCLKCDSNIPASYEIDSFYLQYAMNKSINNNHLENSIYRDSDSCSSARNSSNKQLSHKSSNRFSTVPSYRINIKKSGKQYAVINHDSITSISKSFYTPRYEAPKRNSLMTN